MFTGKGKRTRGKKVLSRMFFFFFFRKEGKGRKRLLEIIDDCGVLDKNLDTFREVKFIDT